MDFKLERAEYDKETQRAYVKFRAPDKDVGQAIATAIFSYRTSERLSKQQLREDIVRKARHLFRRAYMAT
jgi:hypothetical protein